MSSRTCRFLAALAALALAGCADAPRRVDVCGRGDRAELAAALAGGTLELEALDDDGDVIAEAEVPAAGARATLDLGGARVLRVRGRSAAGALVAEGSAPVGAGAPCVCLALAGQLGACAGLGCRVDGDGDEAACRFVDAATGLPAGSRELALTGVDTTLVADAPGVAHDGTAELGVSVGERIALVEFPVEALPRSAVVEEAFLELTLLPPPAATFGIPVAVRAVLEPWDPATATWDEREAGQAWSAAACGIGSCAGEPWAALDPDRAGTLHRVPLGQLVAGWVADPATNHGLALVGAGGLASFWSAESASAGGAPPRLVLRYHMADDDLPPPIPGPICGNGVVEDGEGCDDGDREDGDACTNACQPARCGDGVLRPGVEECDDGNQVNDDGCSLRCLSCDDASAAARFVGADGRCYARYTTPRNYGVAENSCDEAGHGTLAVFETLAEQEEVLAGLGAAATPLWIGLSDRGAEGTFVWANGAPQAYSAFGMGEPAVPPAANNEDCVVVANGAWADDNCNLNRGYLCEQPGWTVDADGRAYLAVVGPTFDWEGAQLECEALEARLAAPITQAEDERVAALVALGAWIGLAEPPAQGALEWITGEPLDYTGFPAPPSLAGDRVCAQIDADDDWSVAPCAARRRFVCEAE